MGPKRFQTSTDRDIAGLKAREARELAAPHEVEEEVTQKYVGIERARRRALRPTVDRLALLERKDDNKAELLANILEKRESRFHDLAMKLLTIIATGLAAYLYGKHGGG